MRRKAKLTERTWRSYDIRKELKPEWLASLGAINVAWNDIEGAINVVVCIGLELPPPLWIEVTSRINGLEGKFALIKKSARVHFRLPSNICDLIDKTIGAIAEHKTYRDALIHAKIIDPDSEVAAANQSKGTEYEVLVSQTALNGLYDRLSLLQHEIDDVLQIMDNRARMALALHKGRKLSPRGPKLRPFVQSIRQYMSLLRVHQRTRLELPPLPQFPQESQAPSAKEGDPLTPD
jgi:hypothetical protein